MKIISLNITKYFLFFLFLLYSLQGVLYPSGLYFAKVVLAIIILFEVKYFFLSIKHIRRNIVNGFSLMLIINVLYYLFSEKTIHVSTNVGSQALLFYSTWISLKNIIFSFGFFFLVYYLSFKRKISEKNILYFYIICFIIAILSYYSTADSIMLETGRDRDEFTNNTGFAFVHLMPFLFLVKRKNIALTILFISLAFIMMAAKRGAIIIGTVFTLFYFYQEYIKNTGRYFIKNLVILFILLVFSSLWIYYFYSNSDYLQLRMEKTLEGNSSGRDIIFSKIWNYWLSPYNSVWNYLFGFGFLASIKIGGVAAHNDWLELLSTAGLFGILIYIIFFYQFFAFSKNKPLSETDKNIIYAILLNWIIISVFSMGYGNPDMISMIVLLAYIVGKYNRI